MSSFTIQSMLASRKTKVHCNCCSDQLMLPTSVKEDSGIISKLNSQLSKFSWEKQNSTDAPIARGIPRASNANIIILTVVNIVVEVVTRFHDLSPPVPSPVLEPHQHEVNQALNRVTADPQPDRRVRILLEGETEHHHGDHHEGHVPRHVKGHHRLRVAPVGTPLLQLTRCRLADQHGRSARMGGREPSRRGRRSGAWGWGAE